MAATEAFLSSCLQGLWSLPHVCAEKDLNICGVFGGKGTLESTLCPKTAQDSTRLSIYSFTLSAWFVCESLVRVEQAFSISNALGGHVRTPLHSRKEHAVYEYNCQPAFKKRFSIQTEWCNISNENTFLQNTALTACSAAMVGSRLRHLTLNNTSFVRGHKISEREKGSAAVLPAGALIS